MLISSGYRTYGCLEAKVDDGERPTILEGSHDLLLDDYTIRKNPIRKCAQVANQMGYDSFAVQDGGICSGSVEKDRKYLHYDNATHCDGGTRACSTYNVRILNTNSR